MKVTIVLANQRSGSTLLCNDINSIGGLGRPGEYFLSVVGKGSSDGNVGVDAVRGMIEKGVVPSTPDVAAIKIMVNYAARVEQHISDRGERLSPAKACHAFVDWARSTYDAVNLVVLVRENTVDQAISRVLASKTGVYHQRRTEASTDYRETLEASNRNQIHIDLLKACMALSNEKQVLRRIARRHADIATLMTYEELVADEVETSRRIREHGTANGFSPVKPSVTRSLKKLVPNEVAAELKAGLREYLDRELLQYLEPA